MIAAAEQYAAAAQAASKLNGGKPIPVDVIGQGKTPIGFPDLVGRPRESIALFEQAKARDPLNEVIALWLAYLYGTVGNYPAAFAEFDRSERLASDRRLYSLSVQIALGSRDRQQLTRWLDKAIEFERGHPSAGDFMGRIKPLLDKPDQALVFLRESAADPKNRSVVFMSQWFAWLGDNETALQMLRRDLMVPAVRYAVLWAIWEPGLAGVRKLPGFQQLVRELGLVDYWRKYGWGDYCKPTTGEDFTCQ
jgi:tetratricopeptide (TPR) repeat protein